MFDENKQNEEGKRYESTQRNSRIHSFDVLADATELLPTRVPTIPRRSSKIRRSQLQNCLQTHSHEIVIATKKSDRNCFACAVRCELLVFASR